MCSKLALYTILVHWYRCKAEKVLHKDLRIRWREAGLRLSTAMEEIKPITEFQANVSKALEDANKEAKDAQTAAAKIATEVDKLKKQDRDLVSFS